MRARHADIKSEPAVAGSVSSVREPFSVLDHDHFKILAGHHHRRVSGAIHGCDQRQQVALQIVLVGAVERGERLEHGAVIGLEDVDEVFG